MRNLIYVGCNDLQLKNGISAINPLDWDDKRCSSRIIITWQALKMDISSRWSGLSLRDIPLSKLIFSIYPTNVLGSTNWRKMAMTALLCVYGGVLYVGGMKKESLPFFDNWSNLTRKSESNLTRNIKFTATKYAYWHFWYAHAELLH